MSFDATMHEIKFAKIAGKVSGANPIVAAVTGKKIRVLSFFIVSAGAVGGYFTSAATAIGGDATDKIAFGTNIVISSSNPSCGVMETVAGEAFGIVLDGAVSVAGGCTYIEV
ncbi:MAG: hypothetical protein ACYSWU_23810 [Planctomycetota bacterium]|jgi:hypothetical protein